MAKQNVIEVPIKLVGLKEGVQGVTSELETISTTAGKKLSKAQKQELDGIRQQMQGMIDKLDTGKASTKSLKNLHKELKEVQKQNEIVTENMKGLADVISKIDNGKFASDIQHWTDNMSQFSSVVNESVEAVKALQKASTSVDVVNSEELKALEKQKKVLKELQESSVPKAKVNRNQINSIEKTISQTQKLTKELESLQKKKNASLEEVIGKKYQLAGLANALDDIKKTDKTLAKDLQNEIKATFTAAYDEINKNFDLIESRYKELEALTANTQNISNQYNKIKDTNNGETVNKLKVPMDTGTSAETLSKRAVEVIRLAQATVNKYPLEVQFSLVTPYATRKTKSALKELQKDIDTNIKDEDLKKKYEKLYEDISKGFQKTIELQITSDIDDEAQKVKNVIDDLRKQFEEKLRIFPTIQPEQKDIDKLQSVLNKASKELTLTIGKVQLSENAEKKIQKSVDKSSNTVQKKKEKEEKIIQEENLPEVTQIKQITGAISESINTLSDQLDYLHGEGIIPIIDSLVEIKGLLESIPQNIAVLPDAIRTTSSAIKEMAPIIEKSLN